MVFILDTVGPNHLVSFLSSITDYLIDNIAVVPLFIIFLTFGLISQVAGIVYTIYPILITIIMSKRTGSKSLGLFWGSLFSTLVLPIGGWFGFLMAKHVLKTWSARKAAKFKSLQALHSMFEDPKER